MVPVHESCKRLMRHRETVLYARMLRAMTWHYDKSIDTACVWCAGAGIHLSVNQEWFGTLSFPEQDGVLVHEALHVALNHFHRKRPDQKLVRWKKACDLSVNSLIAQQVNRVQLPACALMAYNHGLQELLSAEVYYAETKNRGIWHDDESPPAPPTAETEAVRETAEEAQEDDQTDDEGEDDCEVNQDGEASDEEAIANELDGDSEGDPDDEESTGNTGDTGNKEDNEEQPETQEEKYWDSMSDEQARGAIDSLMREALADDSSVLGHLPEQVKRHIEPRVRVRWAEALRRYASRYSHGTIEKVRTWRRVNRRFPGLSPGRKRERGVDYVVALDISGSMDREQIALGVKAVREVTRSTGTTAQVITFNDEICETFKLNGNTVKQLPERGYGGTTFAPVVEHVNAMPRRPELLIIVTDGLARPVLESRVPILFVILNSMQYRDLTYYRDYLPVYALNGIGDCIVTGHGNRAHVQPCAELRREILNWQR